MTRNIARCQPFLLNAQRLPSWLHVTPNCSRCYVRCWILLSPARRMNLLALRPQVLREKYPQFAELSRTGQYAQQDAEECWIQLMYSLRERVQARGVGSSLRPGLGLGSGCPPVNAHTTADIINMPQSVR